MKTTDLFEPHMIIKLSTIIGHKNVSNTSLYLEYAPVIDQKLGSFVPMSNEAAMTFAKSLFEQNDRDMYKGFVPDSIIYLRITTMSKLICWYTRPCVKTLFFSKDLGIKTGKAKLPWLVWLINDESLYVYATMVKPTKTTRLFCAPFHNVQLDGYVCLGTASKYIDNNADQFEVIIKNTIKAFFDSNFTALHGANIKSNLNLFWKKQIEENKDFDNKQLIDSKYKTIAGMIKVQSKDSYEYSDNDFDDDLYACDQGDE